MNLPYPSAGQMLGRRNFLLGAGAMALTQLLSGCSAEDAALVVLLLQGSIPLQLLVKFRQEIERRNKVIFKPKAQLKDLFQLLTNWQQLDSDGGESKTQLPSVLGIGKIPPAADLITLGDYWLTDAIAFQLIQPLEVEQLEGWEKLPLPWQNLVKRNTKGEIDASGDTWGAPYRWGGTVIAYRKDKFKDLGWTPTDWQDLWREELRDRISVLDEPREVIGLTLKKLGHSYNTQDLSKVPALKSELLALQQQVKFYSSNNYIQPLILGDTWLAVGWSTDLLPIQERYPNIEVIFPQSGTSLWADLWVQPKQSGEAKENQSFIQKWIDFCWQPSSAIQISLFTSAASTIILSMRENLPKDIQDNSLLLPDDTILDNSEFLYPLSEEIASRYEALWREIREAGITDKR